MQWASALVSKKKESAKEVDLTVYAAKAEALYNACLTPKPTWQQLGPDIQGVWLLKAKHKADGCPDWWSINCKGKG